MLDVSFFNVRQHRQFQHTAGPMLLARSLNADESWITVDSERAKLAQTLLSITPDADGITLQLAGCEKECYCGRPGELSGSCHWKLPARFNVGDTCFEVAASGPAAGSRRPLATLQADKPPREQRRTSGPGPSPITLSRWFYALGTLQRWGNCPQEFFVQAARCAVESIGLDGAIVVRRRDQNWEIVASHLPMPELGIHCDLDVLDQLLETPRTLFHGAVQAPKKDELGIDRAARLVDQLAKFDAPASDLSGNIVVQDDEDHYDVVVSPLCNAAREVTGAIYGFRSVRAGNARRGIRYLEAHLVELLAGAVTEGIMRLEHDAEAERRQVLLKHANLATPDQEAEQHIVEQREITLLFADLRGSSGLANSLGIERTYELMGDVMDALTAAVMDLDGVIIDYYGDGLAAMWNAPADQADHAELACRAALRMIDALPAVQSKWSQVLADELRLGIGVHTGLAQVGNAGSSRRAKYGPRGANVNLAHRVEAAAKAVGVSAVVTRATASRLSNRLLATRICQVQLPGVESSIDLFEIRQPTTDATVLGQLAEYDRALALFERGEHEQAAECLAKLTPTADSVPVEFLQGQIRKAIGLAQRRRSTDETPLGPVIALNVK
ncbi:MAG TPA: adenylate/guanylate cyclase domain-containing protein [Lacipirellulaceae bacterium]|jgi:adenylate cyclase